MLNYTCLIATNRKKQALQLHL